MLFTLIAERYERRTLGITSNLVFSEWEKVFANRMATAAEIDRVDWRLRRPLIGRSPTLSLVELLYSSDLSGDCLRGFFQQPAQARAALHQIDSYPSVCSSQSRIQLP